MEFGRSFYSIFFLFFFNFEKSTKLQKLLFALRKRMLKKDSEAYNKTMKECHLRTAQRMVKTCLQNGGLYIKMGQALSTMNHVLPREFYTTLRSLQSEALRSEGAEVFSSI